MIYHYFRVTRAHDTVLDYTDLFSVNLHNDNIQDFDTTSDEVLLSMSKIPSDDVLESLYKLRIRESAQQKPYWNCTTWRFIRRCRFRNATHGRIESGAVVKNRMGKVFVSSGKQKACVRKEADAVFVTKPKILHKNQNTLLPHLPSQTHHEVEVCRGREVSEGKVTMGPFFDNRVDVIWEVPARERLVNIGIRPSQFCKTETGCKSGDKCMIPHYKVDEQPNKKPKKKLLPKKKRKRWQERCGYREKVLNAIRKVRFTKSTLRQTSIREKKGPSLGKIKVVLHARSPYAPKFQDRSHEETGWQQRCALEILPKCIQAQRKRHGCILLSRGGMGTPGTKEPEEREFVVDSGASMHLVSKKDLHSAELETMRTSRSPTTVMTANGEVQTKEEATVYVKQLDFFVKVMLLEETLEVLSLGELCEDHGYTYHWTSGRKPQLTKKGKTIDCNITNYVPFVVPGLSASSSSPSSSSTSSPSSSQESTSADRENRDILIPVSKRSRGTDGELQGNPLHESTETEN